MISPPAAAMGVAVALDAGMGEFPERFHPVAVFGRFVDLFDREWRHPQAVGVLLALGLPAIAAMLMGGIVTFAIDLHHLSGVVVAGLVLFSTISLRMLLVVVRDVVDLTNSDIARARLEVRSLVGRDTSVLAPSEIRSAAIESLGENLSDGLVAPLFGFAIGAQVSVAVGVGMAVWIKAVNTLDSMLGYETKDIGWASARLDDLVMWIPARLTAILISVAARDPRSLLRARPFVNKPRSPNSGWPMATIAEVLGVRLQKPGEYTLNPSGQDPTSDHARRAIRVAAVAGFLAVAITGVTVWS